ncbi:hypothetical protein COO60DRAFT_822662 [Scenedesmus sp. NREL 46B-D3]|nr:hypothetical protein COO60DRAFT_822662 [Scenedesmus sp. NREL 46B-D3]
MEMMMPGPPSAAVKAKVLQLFEGDGIPDCVIDGIARRCGVGRNGKLVYAKPALEEENFPVLELMRLQDSRAVRPYLKGYLLRDAGLEAMVRNLVLRSPQLREVAVKGFALGFAECFRVMGVPDDAMLGMSAASWVAEHPQEPLGLLLQAHVSGAQRGDAWLVRRLEQLAPRMPSPLLRAKVLATAAVLQYEQQTDLAGERAVLWVRLPCSRLLGPE